MTSAQQVLDLRLLVPCLTSWAVGAWALSWSGGGRVTGAVVAAVLLAGLALAGVRYHGRHARPSWRRDGPGVLAMTLVATCLVLGASAVHEWRRQLGPVAELAADGSMVRAEGVVLTEPKALRGWAAGDEGTRTPTQVHLRVRLESVTAHGVTTQVHSQVFIRADARWTDVGCTTGSSSPASSLPWIRPIRRSPPSARAGRPCRWGSAHAFAAPRSTCAAGCGEPWTRCRPMLAPCCRPWSSVTPR